MHYKWKKLEFYKIPDFGQIWKFLQVGIENLSTPPRFWEPDIAEPNRDHQNPRGPLSSLWTRICSDSFTRRVAINTYRGKSDNFRGKSEIANFWVSWTPPITGCNKALSPCLIRLNANRTPQTALCKQKTRKRRIGNELSIYRFVGHFELFRLSRTYDATRP